MAYRSSVHKTLLRWSAIIAGCVLVSIALLRVRDRQQRHEDIARAFAEDDRFVAERRKVAGPTEQVWLRKHAAYNALRRREYEWASRWPWRSVKEPSASQGVND